MKWFLIEDEFHTGKYNMEFDLKLTGECGQDEAFVRFYRWKPYAISLGANQKFEEINLTRASEDNIDVVKRPTGGRAILHAEEITYSVVIPVSFGLLPKQVYRKISLSLIRGLALYSPLLGSSELESVQPDFLSLLTEQSGSLCFASTAKNEVKIDHKKIIGSAQRKLKNTILQHGSILCGPFHKKLADYILTSGEEKVKLKNELESKTIDIESVLNEKLDYNKLVSCLISGFEEEWQIKFIKDCEMSV